MADYHYFKPSGKWYTSGVGKPIPPFPFEPSHASLAELNDGMPGLRGHGREFIIVIIDEESFPRLIKNEEEWK